MEVPNIAITGIVYALIMSAVLIFILSLVIVKIGIKIKLGLENRQQKILLATAIALIFLLTIIFYQQPEYSKSVDLMYGFPIPFLFLYSSESSIFGYAALYQPSQLLINILIAYLFVLFCYKIYNKYFHHNRKSVHSIEDR